MLWPPLEILLLYSLMNVTKLRLNKFSLYDCNARYRLIDSRFSRASQSNPRIGKYVVGQKSEVLTSVILGFNYQLHVLDPTVQ